jgi:hypothetical protein
MWKMSAIVKPPTKKQLQEQVAILEAKNAYLEREIERLRETLQRIVQWADAYPIDIFHEPTKEESRRAHELLTAAGMTLDAFSASMGRHCLKGVGDIAREALRGKSRADAFSPSLFSFL